MLIATILLIANLIALVLMDGAFMSFWWVAAAYGIEIVTYIVLWIIMAMVFMRKRW